jgi:WhiB family redox-sensing transcriptional regulator
VVRTRCCGEVGVVMMETDAAPGRQEVTNSMLVRHISGNPDDQAWQAYANCLGVDPDLFFPERGASTREAKEVCRGCVVREECLEYALRNGEKFGIWGGMSERERRRIRRQRALARSVAAEQPSA